VQRSLLRPSFLPDTSDIKCHCSHGIGHFQRNCPNKKSYIAIADGGYVSASDTEDDLTLQTNHACDLADDGDNEHAFGSDDRVQHQDLCRATGLEFPHGSV
jgi:hypothetical protein